MHELGHTIGLDHGGPKKLSQPDADKVDQIALNYKPNYLSVMNYWFQMRGLIKKTAEGNEGYLDYSLFSMTPPLDETRLDERVGLGDWGMNDYGTRWACNGLFASEDRTEQANEPINWDCDLIPREAQVRVDINKDRCRTDGKPGCAILRSFDDWKDLVLGYGCIGPRQPGDGWCANDRIDLPPLLSYSTAAESLPQASAELTLAEDAQILTLYAVNVTATELPLSHDPRRHSYAVTILNTGTMTDTYDLSVTSVAGWVTPPPGPISIDLAPGQAHEFRLALAIPQDAAPGGFDEVSVQASSRMQPNVNDVVTVWATVRAHLYLPLVLRR